MSITLDGTSGITTPGKFVAANMPVGSVLQVVSTTKTDVFSSSSTTFVDVTGLSVSITPTSATSKILVMANVFLGPGASVNGALWRLVRDSTSIAVNTDAVTIPVTGGFTHASATTSNEAYAGVGTTFLEDATDTASKIYKVQFRMVSATIGYLNRQTATGNVGGVSSITVMEIAG